MMQSVLFISLSLTIVHLATGNDWNYRELGPDVWSDTYPLCNGNLQSPINIRTACTTYRSSVPFNFSINYNITQNFTLTNNGHTVIGRYSGSDASALTLTGGNLNGTFQFVNFHLHWGENYKSGSEHQVNGMKYAGEIHFVHFNPKTNRTAVLGVFMESSRSTNTNGTSGRQRKKSILKDEDATSDEWTKYFSSAEQLQDVNNSAVVSLNLGSLMGNSLNDFWRYQGSLTTPPCTEGIIWTIFKTSILFTESDIGSFRKNIFFEDYRGPQPLHDRMVYRNFPSETLSTISDYACCLKSLDSSASGLLLNPDSFSLISIQRLKSILPLFIILFRYIIC